jgi:hypothetical protein
MVDRSLLLRVPDDLTPDDQGNHNVWGATKHRFIKSYCVNNKIR